MQLQQENQLLKVALMGPQAQANSGNAAGNAAGGSKSSGGAKQSAQSAGAGSGLASGIMEAQTPMTDYGTRLAKRSTPSMDSTRMDTPVSTLRPTASSIREMVPELRSAPMGPLSNSTFWQNWAP